MSIEKKKVEDSRVETVHIVRPNHLNGANRLFGGILMQWIDEVAGLVAKRHAKTNVITASVDNLRFLKGAYQNEVIVLIGKLTYVGTTSMEVRWTLMSRMQKVSVVQSTEHIFVWWHWMKMISRLKCRD